MKKSEMNYINLYADDFKSDIWLDYCEACELSRYTTAITIYFDPEDIMSQEEQDNLHKDSRKKRKYSKMYYIILYAEDFSNYEWCEIADICRVDYDCSEIVIYYKRKYLESEEYCEDDEYDEDE